MFTDLLFLFLHLLCFGWKFSSNGGQWSYTNELWGKQIHVLGLVLWKLNCNTNKLTKTKNKTKQNKKPTINLRFSCGHWKINFLQLCCCQPSLQLHLSPVLLPMGTGMSHRALLCTVLSGTWGDTGNTFQTDSHHLLTKFPALNCAESYLCICPHLITTSKGCPNSI